MGDTRNVAGHGRRRAVGGVRAGNLPGDPPGRLVEHLNLTIINTGCEQLSIRTEGDAQRLVPAGRLLW